MLTALRLDGFACTAYGELMTRLTVLLVLLISAVALSGCGIRGELKTPPPVWGADQADVAEQAEASDGDSGDAVSDDAEEEDPGYGIDVAGQP